MPRAAAAYRPRLAYIAHTLNPGGTERLAVDLALAFASRFEVQLICLDQPGLWAAELREHGIAVHCLWRQPGFDPTVIWRLARLLRKGNVDIVHAHQCTPWIYAAFCRLLFRHPRLLLEEHGRFHPEVGKPFRIAVNRLLLQRLTHATVAVSGDIRDRLVKYEGLTRHIHVIYNGTRPAIPLAATERDALRRELGYNTDQLVIGTVGRLDPIKNLPLLLRAFREVRSRHAHVRLLVIGDGPERATIEALTKEYGLGADVKLTGFRGDSRRLLGAMDLFAMTSFSEGTSMALLEAMSAGLPIAVSSVGGNTEIVAPGENGILFRSDDAEDAIAALERLVVDRPLRNRLGMAAQRSFSDRFSFVAMARQYGDIYDGLLGGAA